MILSPGRSRIVRFAENLSGRAFHRRKAHLLKVEEALRNVFHGGCPLPAALEQAGLPGPKSPGALGTNPGDVAAVPSARR